jgi:hypothetical protein
MVKSRSLPIKAKTTSEQSSSGCKNGVVHTRIGDAKIYCGGSYTPSCNGEASLV